MTTTPKAPQTLREAADEWMDAHPVAMALFRRFATQLAARGQRFGFRLVAERVRWESYISPDPNEEFKLNDHHTPYIARRLAQEMPGIAELIECRVTKAANMPARAGCRGPAADPLTEELL